jgi:hypothetical protein
VVLSADNAGLRVERISSATVREIGGGNEAFLFSAQFQEKSAWRLTGFGVEWVHRLGVAAGN